MFLYKKEHTDPNMQEASTYTHIHLVGHPTYGVYGSMIDAVNKSFSFFGMMNLICSGSADEMSI